MPKDTVDSISSPTYQERFFYGKSLYIYIKNNMKPLYTTLIYSNMEKMGLNVTEYCVADCIARLSNNPDFPYCLTNRDVLAKTIGISERQIFRIIKDLIDQGYLEQHLTLKKLRATQKWVDTVEIDRDDKMSPDMTKCHPAHDKMSPERHDKMSCAIYNNNTYNNNTNNDVLVADATEEKIPINKFIELFKGVNPHYDRLFPIKAERKAMEDLLKRYGEDRMQNMLTQLPDIISKPYAPRITSPYSLQKKLPDLLIFLKQENGKEVGNNVRPTIDARGLGKKV